MKTKIILLIILLGLGSSLLAQTDRKFNRKAYKAMEDGNYNEAILNYQKALKENPEQLEYSNNLGHAYYRNQNYESAAESYLKYSQKPGVTRSEQFHNLGNAFLQAGNYDKSIQSYIESLKIDPESEDTKYNLSMAQAMLKQQQQQQQQQQNQDENQDQNQDKNQDKQDQEQDQKFIIEWEEDTSSLEKK